MIQCKRKKNFFSRKKEIVFEKKKLVELNKQKRRLEHDLISLVEMHNLSLNWVQQFPVSAFNYLSISFGSDTETNIFELRSKIRKEHLKKLEELEKIISNVFISNVDLLLAKIKCVEEKIKISNEV